MITVRMIKLLMGLVLTLFLSGIFTVAVIAVEDNADDESSDEKPSDDVVAATLAYHTAKGRFFDVKTLLNTCEDKGKTCKKEKTAMLIPAKEFTLQSVTLMLAKLKFVKEREGLDAETKLVILDAINQLDELKDSLKEAETKDEIIALAVQAKEVWDAGKDRVEQQTLLILKENLRTTIEKSFTVADLARCALANMEENGKDILTLQKDLIAFEQKVETASHALQPVENTDELGQLTREDIKESFDATKVAVTDAKKTLAVLLGKLKNKNGKLCIVDELEPEHIKKRAVENDTSAVVAEELTDEQDVSLSADELEVLLEQYNLLNEYNQAANALDDTAAFIKNKETAGYDASKAWLELQEGRDLLTNLVKKLQAGQIGGAFSAVLNANSKANDAKKNNRYVQNKQVVEEDEAPGTIVSFKACMQKTAYLYQRNKCYGDYKVNDEDKEIVEECLSLGEKDKMVCYDYAASAVEKSGTGQTLTARLENLRDSLEDLEDDVNDLYDDLEDAPGSVTMHEDLEERIDNLLHDVEDDKIDFMQELDEVEQTIEDGDEIQADGRLDTLNDDIDTFIDEQRQILDEIVDDLEDL